MTDVLLALDACTPLTSVRHKGEWSKIVSQLKPDIWEEGLWSHNQARILPDLFDLAYSMALDQLQFMLMQTAEGNMKSVSQH